MRSNGEAKTFSYLLAGLGIGTLFGMLFAPRTGQEMRRYLRECVDEGCEGLKRQAENLKERAAEAVEKGREYVERGRESMGAFESGKEFEEDRDKFQQP